MPSRTGRFRRSERLLQSCDFKRVAQAGRRIAARDFVLLVAPSGPRRMRADEHGAERRIGITVSRKVGSAVVRNRIKRAVREWFRRCRGELAGDVDVVVIARRGAARLRATEVAEQLCELVRRSLAAAVTGSEAST